MAVINFFDTPLSTPSKNKIKKGSSVLTAINKYLDKKPNSQKVEVYNLKTGKTSYKNTEIESYKAAVVVNGKEESLEYKCCLLVLHLVSGNSAKCHIKV